MHSLANWTNLVKGECPQFQSTVGRPHSIAPVTGWNRNRHAGRREPSNTCGGQATCRDGAPRCSLGKIIGDAAEGIRNCSAAEFGVRACPGLLETHGPCEVTVARALYSRSGRSGKRLIQ